MLRIRWEIRQIAGEKSAFMVNRSGKSLSKWTPTDTGKKLLATPACGLEYCTIKLIYFGLYYSFTTAGRKSDTVFEFFCHILDACHTVFNHLVALKFFKGIVHRLTFLGKKNRTNLSLLLLVLHLFM